VAAYQTNVPPNPVRAIRRGEVLDRLVVVETHPIQYHAPVYPELESRLGIPVTAIYGSDFSAAVTAIGNSERLSAGIPICCPATPRSSMFRHWKFGAATKSFGEPPSGFPLDD
jgi:hypothetical protein